MYEFACTDPACDYTAEIESPITDPVPEGPDFHLSADHAEYYPMPVRRVWTAPGVILKGSGWASKTGGS